MLLIAFLMFVPAVRLGISRPRFGELTVVDDAPAWPVEVANSAALLPGAPYPLCGLPDELSEVAVFPIQIRVVRVIHWCLASPSRDDCTPVCRAGRAGVQILPIVAMGMGKCACLSRLHTPDSNCLHMGACSSFKKGMLLCSNLSSGLSVQLLSLGCCMRQPCTHASDPEGLEVGRHNETHTCQVCAVHALLS